MDIASVILFCLGHNFFSGYGPVPTSMKVLKKVYQGHCLGLCDLRMQCSTVGGAKFSVLTKVLTGAFGPKVQALTFSHTNCVPFAF